MIPDRVLQHRRELHRHKWQYNCRMEVQFSGTMQGRSLQTLRRVHPANAMQNPSAGTQCRAEVQCSERTQSSGPVLRCRNLREHTLRAVHSPDAAQSLVKGKDVAGCKVLWGGVHMLGNLVPEPLRLKWLPRG